MKYILDNKNVNYAPEKVLQEAYKTGNFKQWFCPKGVGFYKNEKNEEEFGIESFEDWMKKYNFKVL